MTVDKPRSVAVVVVLGLLTLVGAYLVGALWWNRLSDRSLPPGCFWRPQRSDCAESISAACEKRMRTGVAVPVMLVGAFLTVAAGGTGSE